MEEQRRYIHVPPTDVYFSLVRGSCYWRPGRRRRRRQRRRWRRRCIFIGLIVSDGTCVYTRKQIGFHRVYEREQRGVARPTHYHPCISSPSSSSTIVNIQHFVTIQKIWLSIQVPSPLLFQIIALMIFIWCNQRSLVDHKSTKNLNHLLKKVAEMKDKLRSNLHLPLFQKLVLSGRPLVDP